MNGLNLVVLFSPDKEKVLLCRRRREPYLGLYNFVGGHIEPGEGSDDAAYRELYEETSVTRELVTLRHLMDFVYHESDCRIEVWYGILTGECSVSGEENPLEWHDVSDNFFDSTRFAGEGNMGHIMEQLRVYSECFQQ